MKRNIKKYIFTLLLFILSIGLITFAKTNSTTKVNADKRYEELEKDEDSEDGENSEDDGDSENVEQKSDGFWSNIGKTIGNAIVENVKNNLKSDCEDFFKNVKEFNSAISNNIIFPEKEISVFNEAYNAIKKVSLTLSLSLIILSALIYGFKTYVLWKDGSPDENPFEMVVRYVFAIAMIFCFDSIYNISGNIVVEILEKIEEAINPNNINDLAGEFSFDGVVTTVVVGLIFYLLFLIEYLKALFNMLKKGIELFILRLGSSLVCINLIKPQSAIFSQYIQTILKVYLQIIINVILLSLSILVSYNSSKYGMMWGIACLMLLNSSGQILNNFMIANQGGGGGPMSIISSVTRFIPK